MKKYTVGCNRALSPQEYVNAVTGKLFAFSSDTIGGLIDEIQNRLEPEGYCDLWDYPLEEIDEIVENGLSVVLVELVGEDVDGKCVTMLRWFEVPEGLHVI